MIEIAKSLQVWLCKNNKYQILSQLFFGHLEVFTPEMANEYLEWCKTDEAKPYIKSKGEENEKDKT